MSWKGASSLIVNFAQSMHMFLNHIIVHVGHYDYIVMCRHTLHRVFVCLTWDVLYRIDSISGSVSPAASLHKTEGGSWAPLVLWGLAHYQITLSCLSYTLIKKKSAFLKVFSSVCPFPFREVKHFQLIRTCLAAGEMPGHVSGSHLLSCWCQIGTTHGRHLSQSPHSWATSFHCIKCLWT